LPYGINPTYRKTISAVPSCHLFQYWTSKGLVNVADCFILRFQGESSCKLENISINPSLQIASLPFTVYTKDEEGNISEAVNHPVYPLINFRPDPNLDKFTFMETMVRQLFTGSSNYKGGNALIHIMTDSSGAIDRLHLVTGDWEQFKTGNEYFYYLHEHKESVPASDIIHLSIPKME
jgi:hypothetical protein